MTTWSWSSYAQRERFSRIAGPIIARLYSDRACRAVLNVARLLTRGKRDGSRKYWTTVRG